MGGGGGSVVGSVVGGVAGFMVGGPAGAAAGAGLGAGVGGTYDAAQAQRKANKLQKEQQRLQASIIGKQKSEALEARKNQIAQMREQIGTGGYTTRATSEKGIIGSIKQDTLG
jgi:hypothetical protein